MSSAAELICSWLVVLEVNVIGAVAVSQAVMPMLRDARGRVVNIGCTVRPHERRRNTSAN